MQEWNEWFGWWEAAWNTSHSSVFGSAECPTYSKLVHTPSYKLTVVEQLPISHPRNCLSQKDSNLDSSVSFYVRLARHFITHFDKMPRWMPFIYLSHHILGSHPNIPRAPPVGRAGCHALCFLGWALTRTMEIFISGSTAWAKPGQGCRSRKRAAVVMLCCLSRKT